MMGLSKPTENTGGTKPVAHNDTVFAQVLKLVPRQEFESLARKHKSGRMSRSMTRWGQFVAMGMAQLTGRCSLRDIVSNLAAQSCKLYHLGVGVVTRSSLARVNAEKPWEMYEELHGRLLGRCQAKAPGHGYRFKAKLFSVDSTTIDLCLSAFPWAKFRRTKGAVKVHVGFVGTSRNAVMTQVWTAMCIYLILSYLKFANRIAWRLSEILRLLQLNLFERRPLRELLGSGNESPPDRSSQLTMKGIVPCGVELREWQLPFPLRGRPCYATSATKQSGGSSASNAQTKCRRSR